MNQTERHSEIERVQEEAATWAVRLEATDLSADEIQDFRRWAAASPLHRSLFQQFAALGAEYDALGVLTRETGLQLPPALSETQSADSVRLPAKRVWRAHPTGRWAVAATLLVIVAGALRLFLPSTTLYATAPGQRMEIPLDDGSVVHLDASSRARVRYDFRRRLVELESGEALFSVAKSANRPFLVRSGLGSVTALGTRFNVRNRGSGVTVTVLSGTVLVEPGLRERGSAASRSVDGAHALVRSGQQVAYDDRALSAVTTLPAKQLMYATAWKEGKLYVDGETLSRVIEEFHPYTSKRIVIADGTLQALKVGGMFKIDDTDGFLRLLEDALPITVVNVSSDLVMLIERKEPGAK